MNSSAVVIGFLMCAVGLTVMFVTWNPIGFVLDGLGFMIFLYGLFYKREGTATSTWSGRSGLIAEEYKCTNCVLFGNKYCPRQEKLLNATPCSSFIHKPQE